MLNESNLNPTNGFCAAALSLVLIFPPALRGQSTTTVGGYGEVHYTNSTAPGSRGEVNVKRFVIYLAHSFGERISFRSELEVEDAKVEGGEPGGEVSLEQAFLDFRLADRMTVRAGLLLVPVGILNEQHEPPTFHGVARPDYADVIVPTTWREIGVGLTGVVPGSSGLGYRVYLVNGLVAEGFSAEEGIRGGRQEGRDASFANPSITGRLEYGRPGFKLGGAFYYGGSAEGNPALGSGAFAAPVTLVAGDARYERSGLALRAEAALIHVGDAAAINAEFGNAVGSRLVGWYGEAAYDVLRLVRRSSAARLSLFARHERLNTQARVPAGSVADVSQSRRYTTVGIGWKPVPDIAVKADYQFRRNRGGAAEDEVLRLGIGYAF